ncbi:MAG TPA: hypothetical protein ENJ06_00420 [Phycisphaeraceae bacterium]|nr:hypothetical protein [Phycisphaeraceae bacterium]
MKLLTVKLTSRLLMRRLLILLFLSGLLPAAGCQPMIRGKVIAGDVNFIALVDADDSRLEQPGLSDVNISFTSDPDSLGRKDLGSVVSDGTGGFTFTVNLPAAGLAKYELAALARHPGYMPTRGKFILPGDEKRLLIYMKPGKDNYTEPENLEDEYRRFR